MARSQNGWPASPVLRTRPLVVAGESFSPGVLVDDDVYEVLRYVAEQLHARVEPIVRAGWHQADDWGFYFRPNANDPDELSNHSSATAFDYNATRHPNGVPTRQTFTAAQIAEVHKILDEVDHVVRWGGDYTGTPDAMHFEINADRAAVAAVAARLRGDIDMDETTLRKIIREESTRAAEAAVKKLLDTELGNGVTLRQNIRRGGDTKALATEIAKAVRAGATAGSNAGAKAGR